MSIFILINLTLLRQAKWVNVVGLIERVPGGEIIRHPLMIWNETVFKSLVDN